MENQKFSSSMLVEDVRFSEVAVALFPLTSLG